MGSTVKFSAARARAGWDLKARAEHLRCDVCSALVSYAHRHAFFGTGLCEFCVARLHPGRVADPLPTRRCVA
jgi:hypothetical protein